MKRARHRLAGDLGRAVEIRVVEGMILGHRLLDRVAIDGRRRGIDEPLHARADAGLEHVERAADIHVEGGARILVALQEPQRREMEDAVGALQGRVEDVGLADVAARLEDLDARVLERVGEILGPPAHEIVVDDDLARRRRLSADRPCGSR